ncbi:unnamed protein product [Menidia menidia]|uniref:(Atlantic silverside) hypothetical protein n=1 Tax=Menidia menidia TaxID=238744 RepID=A0A8S4BN73_9TELE|nr:unnamed protein product [Menidia menidia]
MGGTFERRGRYTAGSQSQTDRFQSAMFSTDRNKLDPWIEALILGYGGPEGGPGPGQLKAHVVGLGQMTQSQAKGSEDPGGILFLSDGAVQIPGVLTAAAWDLIQDQEDRDSFSSLVGATVFLQDFQLRFHAAQDRTRSRFFLSVGRLTTTASGPRRDPPPCCTSLASVRNQILRTWRAPPDPPGSSQGGFDLSELLGEWQHDCVQEVLQDIRQRLTGTGSGTGTRSRSESRSRSGSDPGFSVPMVNNNNNNNNKADWTRSVCDWLPVLHQPRRSKVPPITRCR